jgi:hypothetical protein
MKPHLTLATDTLPPNYKPDTMLPADLEEKRAASVARLGTRWLLHPIHSPVKKDYSGWPRN